MNRGTISNMFDPVTRKRLRRFRACRRAHFSLWLLGALYAVSLVSELVCNDRPLYVRYAGRSYFPAFRFYPESTFVPGGRSTRTDYRRLAESPEFIADKSNRAVFPPVPFGPDTSLDASTLRGEETVVLSLRPVQRAGALYVDGDFIVSRSISAGVFFGGDDAALAGTDVSSAAFMTPPLREAAMRRLANAPAPPFEQAARFPDSPAGIAVVSLPAFTPRGEPPRTVRVTLREPQPQRIDPVRIIFDSQGPKSVPRLWSDLPDGTRSNLSLMARAAFSQPVAARDFDFDKRSFRAEASRSEVSFPHPPVSGHWMGLDSAGRDVLARILYGLRTSLTFGLLLVGFSMALGAAVGAVQGYFGGAADITGQRLIEVWSAIPFLYVMLLLGSVFGRSFGLLLACYTAFNWVGISYYMRAEFLRLRKQQFVDAARCLGIRHRGVIFRHIMPNALTPMTTLFPFYLVGAIGSLAALDYLGFGMPPPAASWGELLGQAQQFRWAWWLILYPSAALFVVMMLGVFIGEGVRDAFDPKPFSRLDAAASNARKK